MPKSTALLVASPLLKVTLPLTGLAPSFSVPSASATSVSVKLNVAASVGLAFVTVFLKNV